MKYEVMHFVNKWVRRTKSLLSARGQETEDQKEHQEKSTRHFIIFSGFSGFIKVHTGKTAPCLSCSEAPEQSIWNFPLFSSRQPKYLYVRRTSNGVVSMYASISTKDSYRYIFSGRSLPINLIFFWTEWLHCRGSYTNHVAHFSSGTTPPKLGLNGILELHSLLLLL